MKNPYHVLGLDKSATTKQIKKAFRILSMKKHPDKGGSAEEFDELKKSYEILITPHKRKQFDETGTVDEDRNKESLVIQQIAQTFFSIIKSNKRHIEYVDIIKMMKEDFNNGINTGIDAQNSLHKDIETLEAIKSKISSNDDESENLLHNFIDTEIASINNSINSNKDLIEMLETCKTMIEIYSYEYKISERMPGSFSINL